MMKMLRVKKKGRKGCTKLGDRVESCCVSPLVVHNGSQRLNRGREEILCLAMEEEGGARDKGSCGGMGERKDGARAWTMRLTRLCQTWTKLSRQTWVRNGERGIWTTPELESDEAADEGVEEEEEEE